MRKLEIFLDRLGFEVMACAEHLLDDKLLGTFSEVHGSSQKAC